MKSKIINSSAAADIENAVSELAQYFTEISHAFSKHRLSLKYEQMSKQIDKKIRDLLVRLHENIAELDNGEAICVQACIINISKIFYNLLHLSHEVEIKVKDNILFSDEAAGEINQIMLHTIALMPHVADSLRTRNSLIISHVEKEVASIRELAAHAAQRHRDRLCTGACHPKASTVYSHMLQHLQDILWHYSALVSNNGVPNGH